ncbi:uncharacterized protein LOC111313187 [Durio zibethinus]|uniref:Uncharacterized protein LOC111313187 n=1 Tax=Durio zibethinus TaxID=66656 RepID=A0A6P6AXK4_DURZI|nr:uncharacterized protein LOC111313187 [Durio zibethinus]
MKVVVEILTGNLFYIQVGNDATVGDLKKEIEAQENLPRDRMIMIVDHENQNHLITEEDGASLVGCGVQDGSHIYLFFNLLEAESPYHHVFTLPESLLW